MNIPDTKNIFEIIYRYNMKGVGIREFYLEGEDVKKFMTQIGGASIMSVTHGMTFEPLNWKVRKIEAKK
jgi:hypothetical protein